jgi:hypothetical protein
LSVLWSLEDGMMVSAVTESQLCNHDSAEKTLTLRMEDRWLKKSDECCHIHGRAEGQI